MNIDWLGHLALAALVVLYVVVFGQNWTWYAGAMMLFSIRRDYATGVQADALTGSR